MKRLMAITICFLTLGSNAVATEKHSHAVPRNQKEKVVISVPTIDFKSPKEAINRFVNFPAGATRATDIHIKIAPGMYFGEIDVQTWRNSKRSISRIRLSCEDRANTILISMESHTISFGVPHGTLMIENCTIVNLHPTPYTWGRNAIVHVFSGSNLTMKNNFMFSLAGNGIAMAYVMTQKLEDNIIIVPRIGILDTSNNREAKYRMSMNNTIIGAMIPHYFDRYPEKMPQDHYVQTGINFPIALSSFSQVPHNIQEKFLELRCAQIEHDIMMRETPRGSDIVESDSFIRKKLKEADTAFKKCPAAR